MAVDFLQAAPSIPEASKLKKKKKYEESYVFILRGQTAPPHLCLHGLWTEPGPSFHSCLSCGMPTINSYPRSPSLRCHFLLVQLVPSLELTNKLMKRILSKPTPRDGL
jgi:hypothetical protein